MLAKMTARRMPRVKSPSPSLRAIFTSKPSSETKRCFSGLTLDPLPLRLNFFFFAGTIRTRSNDRKKICSNRVGTGKERFLGASPYHSLLGSDYRFLCCPGPGQDWTCCYSRCLSAEKVCNQYASCPKVGYGSHSSQIVSVLHGFKCPNEGT